MVHLCWLHLVIPHDGVYKSSPADVISLVILSIYIPYTCSYVSSIHSLLIFFNEIVLYCIWPLSSSYYAELVYYVCYCRVHWLTLSQYCVSLLYRPEFAMDVIAGCSHQVKVCSSGYIIGLSRDNRIYVVVLEMRLCIISGSYLCIDIISLSLW